MVKEVGEVEEAVVVSELSAEVANQMRHLPSIRGMRRMLSFPWVVLRDLAYELRVKNRNLPSTAEKGDR
jgi:hypothetical protein